MMMPMHGSNQMMPMMVGGFGGVDNSSKGRKGKGGNGAKAGSGGRDQAQGKGGMMMQVCQPSRFDESTWHNPQPAFPCPDDTPRTISRTNVRSGTTSVRSARSTVTRKLPARRLMVRSLVQVVAWTTTRLRIADTGRRCATHAKRWDMWRRTARRQLGTARSSQPLRPLPSRTARPCRGTARTATFTTHSRHRSVQGAAGRRMWRMR